MQSNEMQKHGYEVIKNGRATEIYRNGNLATTIFERKNAVENQESVPVGSSWFNRMASSVSAR